MPFEVTHDPRHHYARRILRQVQGQEADCQWHRGSHEEWSEGRERHLSDLWCCHVQNSGRQGHTFATRQFAATRPRLDGNCGSGLDVRKPLATHELTNREFQIRPGTRGHSPGTHG